MFLSGMDSIRKTHYEVLSVKEDASYDDIRAHYRTVILKLHPDKLLTDTKSPHLHHESQERFLSVQKAWEILSDSTSRANYDKELQSCRQKVDVVTHEVRLEDMMTGETVGGGDDAQDLHYECRCGDYFSITSLELEELGIKLNDNGDAELQSSTDSSPTFVLLSCGSCSLKIRLVIDFDQ